MGKETAALAAQPSVYLIWKQGAYYRPNSQGYTTSAIQAGRYTLADAISITHPNGPDGPRDGMGYVHEDEVIDADWQAYQAQDDTITAQAAEIALARECIANLEEMQARDEAALAAALARVNVLEGALNVALGYASPIFCTDAITCADWFVACAAVQCGISDVDGKIAGCIASADAALKGETP